MSDTRDAWRDRLSEYLDDGLDGSERADLEEHLVACAECRTVLAELREVVARAGELVDAPPARDLWPGIAERIEAGEEEEEVERPARRRGRSFTFTMPQLAAAAALLVVLSSGVAWQVAQGLADRGNTPPERIAQAPTAARTGPAADLLPFSRTASNDYEAAIAQLENVLAAGRERLDTATVRKVEEKLALIDRAIEEARQALATDPSNAYLTHYLAGTMRRKLDLLRRTAALTET